MLMYFYVHCAFFFLKSYYMTHSPPFLGVCGHLIQILRREKMLMYFYMYTALFSSLNLII